MNNRLCIVFNRRLVSNKLCNLSFKVAGINRKSVYQYDLEGNFIKEWYSNHSVCEYLYGSKRKGNLRRDILSNNRKGKLGFTKKGSIWSYYSPNERRAY